MTEEVKKIKIIFVCFANVCRSTMAEFVFKNIVRRQGLEDKFDISSAGVFDESVGMQIHEGTKEVLDTYGIPYENREARKLTKAEYDSADMIVCMDRKNVEAVMEIGGEDPSGKIHTLLSFAGEEGDVPDPWYTHDFDETYDKIIEGCRALMESAKTLANA
ncbi:MAG: low molecular weight protein-tyrosine-phosphatase [Bacillota bacterium]|nr:low molecular weight protein-tyrosine-phosphatase [Bacillota bacterium]